MDSLIVQRVNVCHAQGGLTIISMAIDTGEKTPHNSRFIYGGVPERPKGADCKSAGSAFEGSNPSPSTKLNKGVKTVCAGAYHVFKYPARV